MIDAKAPRQLQGCFCIHFDYLQWFCDLDSNKAATSRIDICGDTGSRLKKGIHKNKC